MSAEFIIVSGSDSGYFPLLKDLVCSIRDKREGECTALAAFDVGLRAEERDWLERAGVKVASPGWDLEFPRRDQMPIVCQAQIARAFLPRHFPGYRFYIWIDADAWVQEWSAVEMLLAAARDGALAICPEIDRSYKRHYKRPKFLGLTLPWRCYREAFGWRVADRLGRNPMLNSGVFALRGDTPHWQSWADAMSTALKRTNFFL